MSIDIQHVGVVGAGRMGAELFRFFAGQGLKATLVEKDGAVLDKHRLDFLKDLDRALEAGEIDEDAFHERKGAAVFSASLSDLAGCDLVVEAIVESATKKKALFQELDGLAKEACVFTSTSSSIVPSAYAPDTARASRTFGLHFFHPPAPVGVVELIRSPAGDKDVEADLVDFLDGLDKSHFLETEADAFVVNRCIITLQAQAYRFVEEGRASFAQVDALVKERLLTPGLFELMVRLGLDLTYPSVARFTRMQPEIAEFTAPLEKILGRLVDQGRRGAKSGRGFFDYEGGDLVLTEKPEALSVDVADQLAQRMKLLLINQVYYFVTRQVALEADLASYLQEAFGVDVGIEQWMDGDDLRGIGRELKALHDSTGDAVFEPNGPLADFDEDEESLAATCDETPPRDGGDDGPDQEAPAP